MEKFPTKQRHGRKVTAPMKRFAEQWAKNPYLWTHTEFCRKFDVNPNTGYRLLASSLAEIIRDKK